ncbi:MAG: hypothetical protein RR499_05725, partial [Mucinivorans sp.]
LGSPWRMPTTNEIVLLCKGATGTGWVAWGTVGGAWGSYGGVPGGYFNGTSASPTTLFFPASGFRSGSDGSFGNVSSHGYYWSSTINNSSNSYNLQFNQSNGAIPQNNNNRSNGFPVRCVQ